MTYPITELKMYWLIQWHLCVYRGVKVGHSVGSGSTRPEVKSARESSRPRVNSAWVNSAWGRFHC